MENYALLFKHGTSVRKMYMAFNKRILVQINVS